MEDQQLWPDGVQVVWLDDVTDSQRNLDLEWQLGEAVARGERPPLIRVWRAANRPGIGVTRRDVAAGQGEQAAARLRQAGWDVVVRTTGGTAVPQGPGVVHVSYLFPRTERRATTDAYYRLLTRPLLAWLAQLGLAGDTGSVPGSYCDGTYNVLVGGRKLVGTAQAWRGGLAGTRSNRPGYVLAHACMPVDVDVDWATDLINRFYADSGSEYRVQRETFTTLRQLAPERFSGMTPAECTAWVAERWVEWYRRWA
ncbi:MAG: ligase [Alicyclobacillus sp.]|nr:ligase [Alicyclobacillus sp.]